MLENKIVKHKDYSKIKMNLDLLFLGIMLFINESYLYIFPKSIIYSITQDILLVWGGSVYIRYGRIKREFKYRKNVLLLFTISLISIVKASYVNDEPIFFALEETRTMFVVLLYFPLKCLLDKYGYKNVTSIVIKFGNFVSILLIIQWIIYPKFIFLNTNSGERFGNYRTYYYMALTIFTLFFYLSKVLTQKATLVNYMWLGINFFAFFFVQQTKSAIYAVLCSAVLVFWGNINKGKIVNKIILVCLSLILLYLAKEYIGLFYEQTISTLNEALLTKTGNIGVRIKLIKFILASLKNNYLFGLGYYSGHWYLSDYITGWAYGLAMGDVGLFAYVFHVGIVGFLISIFYLVHLANNILRINKKNNFSCFGKLVIFYFIFISFFNYYFTTSNMLFYLIIYTCIFENALSEEKRLNE